MSNYAHSCFLALDFLGSFPMLLRGANRDREENVRIISLKNKVLHLKIMELGA